MFFVQDYRERIKEENPDASFGEVGKLLGAKWKEMSDAEKKVSLSAAVVHSRLYRAASLTTPSPALRAAGRAGQGPSRQRQGRLQPSQGQEDQGCRVSVVGVERSSTKVCDLYGQGLTKIF